MQKNAMKNGGKNIFKAFEQVCYSERLYKSGGVTFSILNDNEALTQTATSQSFTF